MSAVRKPKYWVVIPAAGSGRRMHAEVPKQYLRVGGRFVLEHSLRLFSDHGAVDGIVVAVAADDRHWAAVECPPATRIETVAGGPERCHSVLNALGHLSGFAAADDWVLVHDAARPCLTSAEVDALIAAANEGGCGAVLGFRVRDTIKRVDAEHRVFATLDRADLWHAATPQMFRLGALRDALLSAVEQGTLVTDESGAMELAGYRPKMVEGSAENIKITRPGDLALAAMFLQWRRLAPPTAGAPGIDDGQ